MRSKNIYLHLFVIALTAWSLVFPVSSPAQRMSVARTADSIQIEWPASTAQLILQFTTNLMTATWLTAPGFNPNATHYLVPTNGSGSVFYRLLAVTDTNAESEIRALMAKMKSRAEAHDVTGFLALFASDYVHFGENMTDLHAGLENAIPTVKTFDWEATNIVIRGNLAQIQGQVKVTFNNGEPPLAFAEPAEYNDSPGFGWLTKTADGWKIHGSQVKAEVDIATSYNGSQYEFRMSVNSSLAISAVTVSGPNIVDTALTYDTEWESYTGWATPTTPPAIGTAYAFQVRLGDGTEQTLTAKIKSYINQIPGPVSAQVNTGTVQLQWPQIIPAVPLASGYWIWVSDAYGHVWRSDSEEYLQENSLTISSSTLGFPLVSGRSYSVSVFLFNKYDDFSSAGTAFVMP